MAEILQKLAKRSDKVAFMKVADKFHRMKGFTGLSTNKNPKEYTRQYVDEEHETTDIVGLSTSIDFNFDQLIGNPVHDELVRLIDNEIIGTDAVIEILVVDFTKKSGSGYEARTRKYAVIPNTEGGSLDAYTYEGTFRVNGTTKFGVAQVKDDDALEATFTEGTTPPVVEG